MRSNQAILEIAGLVDRRVRKGVASTAQSGGPTRSESFVSPTWTFRHSTVDELYRNPQLLKSANGNREMRDSVIDSN